MRSIITLLSIIIFLCSLQAAAQGQQRDIYWLHLSDKQASPYSVLHPQTFLSTAALERRRQAGIAVTEQDMPVNPAYIAAIRQSNVEIHSVSKWFNAVAVYADADQIAALARLPFVRRTQLLHRSNSRTANNNAQHKWSETFDLDTWYGGARTQIEMLNLHQFHRIGLQGQGMLIAVIDAGFPKYKTSAALQHLIQEQRIKHVWNYVNNSADIENTGSTHGANVLSILAGNYPDKYYGSAPAADYMLFVSEDVSSETPIEEVNWTLAAEFADSAGADIFSTSLGYYLFDDGYEDYTYNDMNGDYTIITRAADIAASKGILVINAAGNEGNSPWNYIIAPADGDSVLSVGAVDKERQYAGFSSRGPSYDGRIKPNVATMGQATALISDTSVYNGSGTSYACPLMSGAAACLWQSLRYKSSMELFAAIQQSASQYTAPDDRLGYGIPDMVKAHEILASGEVFSANLWTTENVPRYVFHAADSQAVRYYICDLAGRVVMESDDTKTLYELQTISAGSSLSAGMYIVQVQGEKGTLTHSFKLVVQ
ncbi:MAG: S8 family serine peptidase [Sphingobacteriales bacterium]|nr:S8 family serine peptidase [Sphingobacteriales bacterium]